MAHIPKGAVDQRGPARPFGSVFFGNLARSVWELRRAEDDTDNITMALYHRKANSGRLHPPIGLRFGFATDRITVTAHNLSDEPDLRARLPLAIQIKGALRGGWLSAAKMADQLGVEVETIGRTLRRLEEKGAVTRRPNSKPIEWGLATR